MNRLERGYIWLSVRAIKAKENMKEFWDNQTGVSNVVATIIVLLITVLLVAAFWGQLKEWAQDLMDQIFGTGFNSSGLDGGNP